MKSKKRIQLLMVIILAVCLTLGTPLPAYAGENDMLSEVRELLRENFVDPVSEDVLQAPTIEEMLDKLGDKNTQYFTKTGYDQFMDTLNRSFSGVGIELQMVPQGVQVTRVFPGYGADKAGIKQGDIITEAQGDSFAGKTSEYCVTKLKGPEGTKVDVKIKRGTDTLSFTLERMQIVLPLVESKVLENHIGYIAVYSFGTDTGTQFGENFNSLKEKGVDSWIIDLRDNGGGYIQAAFDLLGYFIGDKTAVIVKNRSPLALAYGATKQNNTLEGPIILLANGYTASASEITTGAIKDYSAATILGETTYGSGRVKALMSLSNGDYIKMSVDRFFSPSYNSIDEVGISPHLDLTGFDELSMAVMLLKNQNLDVAQSDTLDKTGYLQLDAGPNDFVLSLAGLRKTENWKLGKKIFDTAYKCTTLKLGGVDGWEAFPEEYLNQRQKIYYPGYADSGNLRKVSLDKKFTVTFGQDMDWKSVSADSIELINADTGERTKCNYVFTDKVSMKVNPQTPLKAKAEYWLVIHPDIKDAAGNYITGGVAVAKTVSE